MFTILKKEWKAPLWGGAQPGGISTVGHRCGPDITGGWLQRHLGRALAGRAQLDMASQGRWAWNASSAMTPREGPSGEWGGRVTGARAWGEGEGSFCRVSLVPLRRGRCRPRPGVCELQRGLPSCCCPALFLHALCTAFGGFHGHCWRRRLQRQLGERA